MEKDGWSDSQDSSTEWEDMTASDKEWMLRVWAHSREGEVRVSSLAEVAIYPKGTLMQPTLGGLCDICSDERGWKEEYEGEEMRLCNECRDRLGMGKKGGRKSYKIGMTDRVGRCLKEWLCRGYNGETAASFFGFLGLVIVPISALGVVGLIYGMALLKTLVE